MLWIRLAMSVCRSVLPSAPPAAVISRIVAPDMIADCTASAGFSMPGRRNLESIHSAATAPKDSATLLLVNHAGLAKAP